MELQHFADLVLQHLELHRPSAPKSCFEDGHIDSSQLLLHHALLSLNHSIIHCNPHWLEVLLIIWLTRSICHACEIADTKHFTLGA